MKSFRGLENLSINGYWADGKFVKMNWEKGIAWGVIRTTDLEERLEALIKQERKKFINLSYKCYRLVSSKNDKTGELYSRALTEKVRCNARITLLRNLTASLSGDEANEK